MSRVYRITDAGAKALKAKDSVPAWYRELLKHLVGSGKAPAAVCRLVKRHPARRVLAWLDELDTLGFVESTSSGRAFDAKYQTYREALPELQPILDKFETLRI